MNEQNGMGFLALILIIALFCGNGNGGILGGNCNNSAQTAYATADIIANRQISGGVEALQVQTANNGAAINSALRGIDDLQASFSTLNTSLCQAVNNLTQQNNQLQNNMDKCCCELKNEINASEARVVGLINAQRMEDLKNQISELKTANSALTLAASQQAQTCELKQAIASANGCCNAYGACVTGCNPCANAAATYWQNQMTQIQSQLAAILAKIPTTTTAA